MDISFKTGSKVLQSFRMETGDVSLRSIRKWDVEAFLERSILSDVTWLLRYRILKAFFEHWMARGQLSELPIPPARRTGTARVFIPYIYSTSEIRRLLQQAGVRRHPASREFSSLTFQSVLLFLYGTGTRISEALSLKIEDMDLQHGTVTIHPSTGNRPRTIPISAHLWRSLRQYDDSLASCSDYSCRKTFFVRKDGRHISPVAITLSFKTLRHKLGISRPADISRQPRVQDLRRTFAVHCMRAWLKRGNDIRSMLPVLGAYLGHVNLTSTEAYLSVTPERFSVQLSRLGSIYFRRRRLR
jgi:integrase/recombinase XerD